MKEVSFQGWITALSHIRVRSIVISSSSYWKEGVLAVTFWVCLGWSLYHHEGWNCIIKWDFLHFQKLGAWEWVPAWSNYWMAVLLLVVSPHGSKREKFIETEGEREEGRGESWKEDRNRGEKKQRIREVRERTESKGKTGKDGSERDHGWSESKKQRQEERGRDRTRVCSLASSFSLINMESLSSS